MSSAVNRPIGMWYKCARTARLRVSRRWCFAISSAPLTGYPSTQAGAVAGAVQAGERHHLQGGGSDANPGAIDSGPAACHSYGGLSHIYAKSPSYIKVSRHSAGERRGPDARVGRVRRPPQASGPAGSMLPASFLSQTFGGKKVLILSVTSMSRAISIHTPAPQAVHLSRTSLYNLGRKLPLSSSGMALLASMVGIL